MAVAGSARIGRALIAEWDAVQNDGVDPSGIARFSNKSFAWICPAGHSYEAVVAKRSQGRGCPYCAGVRILPGFNDFASQSPDLVSEWDGEKNGFGPDAVTAWTATKAWWLCPQGHSYGMEVKKRSRGLGCTVCRGYLVNPGDNDLATLHPTIARELVGADPTKVGIGKKDRHTWRCSRGHTWLAEVKTRVYGHGCPYCSGVRVLPGFNDILTTSPQLVAEWNFARNSVLPSQISAGSKKKVWWICSQGHEWKVAVYSRKNRGCPGCSLQGTSKTEQGLYLELQSAWSAAEHRAEVPVGVVRSSCEVDILSGDVVVEYDGSYFHRDAEKRDTAKTEALLHAGFFVVRVREINNEALPHLTITNPRLVQISHRYGDDLGTLANQIVEAVNEKGGHPCPTQ